MLPSHYPHNRQEARLFAVQTLAAAKATGNDAAEILALVSAEARADTPLKSSPEGILHLHYCLELISRGQTHQSPRIEALIRKHSGHHPMPWLHQVIIIVAELSNSYRPSTNFLASAGTYLAEALLPDEERKLFLKEFIASM